MDKKQFKLGSNELGNSGYWERKRMVVLNLGYTLIGLKSKAKKYWANLKRDITLLHF